MQEMQPIEPKDMSLGQVLIITRRADDGRDMSWIDDLITPLHIEYPYMVAEIESKYNGCKTRFTLNMSQYQFVVPSALFVAKMRESWKS